MLRSLLICLICLLAVACVPTSNNTPRPDLISGHHHDIYPLNFREIVAEHARDNYRFTSCYVNEPQPSEFNTWVGNFVLTDNRGQNALFTYRLSQQGEVQSKQINADPYEIVEIKEQAQRGEIRNPVLVEYRERQAFYNNDHSFERQHARFRAFQREQFAQIENIQRQQVARMQAMLYQAERMRREQAMRYQAEHMRREQAMRYQRQREEMEYQRQREEAARRDQEARKIQQQRERKEAAQREKQRKEQLVAQKRKEKLAAQQRQEQTAPQQRKKPKTGSSGNPKELERFLREAGDI